MTLPPLAPLASRPVRRNTPAPRRVPTDSDWTILYPEIDRLYVVERRKLRYVMQYVEKKYGFKVTEQMYKKRFIRWGMRKKPRHSTALTPPSTSTVSRRSSQFKVTKSIPASCGFTNEDHWMSMFLASVRTWSLSFYESVSLRDTAVPSYRQSWPEECEQVNFVFKLVIDMLDRGHGTLAGRVARKAFLMVEEMVALEGPALMWNMLEIMHFMLKLRHLKLFQLLLSHLVALVDTRMSKNHPLPTMLRALRTLVASSPDLTHTPRNISVTPPPSPPSPPSLTKHEKKTADGSEISRGELLFILQRAWTLNAEILFDHFDQRLFQLYVRVHWDSCSIEPPAAIVGAAKQWLADVTPQSMSHVTRKMQQTDYFIQVTRLEEDGRFQQLFATPTNTSPPSDYQTLCTSSIAALQDHASSIISNSASSAGDTAALLRILAGLVTARIVEELRAITRESDVGIGVVSSRSRAQAGNTAGAIRTSLDLSVKHHELGTNLDTVKRIRSIIALLEYSKTGADPRVIREMWLLEDALFAAGEYEEALKIKQLAYQRSEQYLQDIPADSV